MAASKSRLPDALRKHEQDLLERWLTSLVGGSVRRDDLMREGELREQCREFLRAFTQAVSNGNGGDLRGAEWTPVKDLLSDITRSRVRQGFTPSQVASFVFSLKRPLFDVLRREAGNDGQALADETILASELLDQLGLLTTEIFQKSREEVIARQQQDMLELSTPVVKLFEGILALPLIGTLDSARTQVVMESLLQRIVETGAATAIIDITGVPTVDTLVAQHLLKTITAARLMGADCIISGIRPQIAQTIVHLGVDLSQVITKASLSDAFSLALRQLGFAISRKQVDRLANGALAAAQPNASLATPRGAGASPGL